MKGSRRGLGNCKSLLEGEKLMRMKKSNWEEVERRKQRRRRVGALRKRFVFVESEVGQVVEVEERE